MTQADRVYQLETAVARGEEAAREFKVLTEAFAKYRTGVVEAWQATDPRDEKGREKLWVATTILSHVERTFRTLIESGIVAKKELEAIRTVGEPQKRPFLRRLV